MQSPSPSNQEVAKLSQICRQCKVPTAIIEDHQQGDIICTECGLVLEQRTIDESSEWRTFSDSDKAGVDPNRTAGPTNLMLTNGGLATTIGKNPDGTYNQTLTRLHNRGMNPDRALIAAFTQINEMADRLGMNTVVKDGACDLYRMVVEGRALQGKSQAAMHAACLYIACRQEGMTRTFKEVCGAATGTTVKEIGKCYKFILKVCEGMDLSAQMGKQMITPELLTNRFCGNLGLAQMDFIKVCTNVIACFRDIRNKEGHKSEKQPASVAAAAIYFTVQIKGLVDRVNLQKIAEVSGMTEGTIRVSYEDMYPYAKRLVPAALADRVDSLQPPHVAQPALGGSADDLLSLPRSSDPLMGLPKPTDAL